MVASTTNTAALNSLVSVANSKIEPKLLTDNNFEILSIKPLTLTTSKHNTVAEIRVDLGANLPTKVLTANDRYSLRTVEFTRIDLKDIAKFRNLTVNEKGQYVADVTDLAGVIELLGANIAEDELTLIPLSDAFIVKAAPDSLGYVGSITFARLGDVDVTPSNMVVTMIDTLTVGQEATASLKFTPANVSDKTVTVTAAPEGIVVLSDDGLTAKAIRGGTVTLTYVSKASPELTATKTVEVTDPNQGVNFSAKVSYQEEFGAEMGRNLANDINVGDILNVIVRAPGLAAQKEIEIKPNAIAGLEYEFLDSPIQTMIPGEDLVVGLAITATTNPSTALEINLFSTLTGDHLTQTNTATIHNPAVILTEVTISNTPPQLPAGLSYGTSAQINVTGYTCRSIVWSSSHPELITFTPNEYDALNTMVLFSEDIVPGTMVTLTCTVDGVVGTSSEIKIFAA